MNKTERLRLLNIALKLHQETDIGTRSLIRLFKISYYPLMSFFKNHNVQARTPNSHNVWDKAVLMFETKSVDEIALELNINRELLQLLYDNRQPSTKEILKLVASEYLNTKEEYRSIGGLAKKYGLKRSTIEDYFKQKHILLTHKKGYIFHRNSAVFDVIDTEEKAYWLGFLYADGCVAAGYNTVQLSLAIKDIEHIRKFKKFTEYEGTISYSEAKMYSTDTSDRISLIASISISDTHMHDALIKLGCVPNKSLILDFPEESLFMDKNLIYDFIRGYVDGDGTLGVYPHSTTNPNLEASLLIVGTKPFLEGVQKYLGPGFLRHKSNCGEKTFRLGYHTKKAEKAAELLYKNATVYLDRKYNTYITKFAALKSGKNGES